MNKIEQRKIDNIPFFLDEKEIYNFITRLTNETYASTFKVIKIDNNDPYDYYKMYCKDNKIIVEATSGVAFATAFNYYLNNYCSVYIGFITRNGILPIVPPMFNEVIENKSKFLYRYFLNYCTFGYSFAYFKKNDFEHLLDVIFLNGYNLVLNPVGQEAVWHRLLLKLGYSKEEAKAFLVPLPFMPWFNMMNMSSEEYDYNFEDRINLARFINNRLYAFGASPMKVGYAGMVPNDYSTRFKDSLVKNQGLWCGYDRPEILLYNDCKYDEIASLFYKIQDELLDFKDSHFYSIDPFHEGGIKDGINITEFGIHNYNQMHKHDSKAVWAFQGWGDNPDIEMLKGLNKEDVLVINLKADKIDLGYPYIFGCVNNYGGKNLLRGNIKQIIEKSYESNIGVGMLPEGVENSEILFDLFSFISVNSSKVNIEEFINYYIKNHFYKNTSNIKDYLNILANDIYINEDQNPMFESGFNATPSLTVDRHLGCSTHAIDIYPLALFNASIKILNEFDNNTNNDSYIFELIDTIRQLNANYSWHLVYNIQKSYFNKDLSLLSKNKELFLELFDLQIKLLSCHKNYTLTYYLRNVDNDIDLMFAKRLINSWADINYTLELNDYAMREYSELLENYNLPRWNKFLSLVEDAIKNNKELVDYDYIKDSIKFNNDGIYKYNLKQVSLKEVCEKIINIIKNNKF